MTCELNEYIDSLKDELIKLTKDLIKIPTVNPPGKNYEEFSAFVSDWLTEIGFKVTVIEIRSNLDKLLQPKAYGPRFNVLAKLKGSLNHPILHFNGHYDVVAPCVGWTKEPFIPIVEGGRLYGLGASDMKGGISAFMIAIKTLVDCKIKLNGQIVISLTPDEEYSSKAGIRYLFDNELIKADYAIIGEGSSVNNVVIGQKGAIWGQIRVRGVSAHGSVPESGVNAFEKLAKVALAIEKRLKPKLAKRVSKYQFRPKDANKPTIMLGGIHEGANRNRAAVPEWSSMSFDRRVIPEEGMKAAETELISLLDDLMKEDPKLDVEISQLYKGKGYVVPKETKLCRTLQNSIQEVTGRQATFTFNSGWGEAVYFADIGAETAIYGPGISGCAHAKDEYVLIDDLIGTCKVYASTILSLLGKIQ